MKYWNILGAILVMALVSGCCGSTTSSTDDPPSVVTPAPVTPTPGVPNTKMPMPPPIPNPMPGVPTKGVPMPMGGNVLNIGMPAAGVFTPGLPMTPDGKPFIDYTLNIASPGNYSITLMSSNTSSYDPYIILLQGMTELGRDDDGAGSLQSRLTQMLQPGSYTVRVTKFGSSQISTPVPFTLTVTPG